VATAKRSTHRTGHAGGIPEAASDAGAVLAARDGVIVLHAVCSGQMKSFKPSFRKLPSTASVRFVGRTPPAQLRVS